MIDWMTYRDVDYADIMLVMLAGTVGIGNILLMGYASATMVLSSISIL
jgi:hypothetical protein